MNKDDSSSSRCPKHPGDDAFQDDTIPPFGGIILGPDGVKRCCFASTPEQRQQYAAMLIRQSGDPAYRERLLTFAKGSSIDWADYTDAERDDMFQRTRKAMEEAVDPLLLVPSSKYVVLSNHQFTRNVYRMKTDDEVVLRVPDILPADVYNKKLQTQSVAELIRAELRNEASILSKLVRENDALVAMQRTFAAETIKSLAASYLPGLERARGLLDHVAGIPGIDAEVVNILKGGLAEPAAPDRRLTSIYLERLEDFNVSSLKDHLAEAYAAALAGDGNGALDDFAARVHVETHICGM
ncbi:MAG: hypothetical protein WCJ69_15630 [Betaproteobacteria bacterium]